MEIMMSSHHDVMMSSPVASGGTSNRWNHAKWYGRGQMLRDAELVSSESKSSESTSNLLVKASDLEQEAWRKHEPGPPLGEGVARRRERKQ